MSIHRKAKYWVHPFGYTLQESLDLKIGFRIKNKNIRQMKKIAKKNAQLQQNGQWLIYSCLHIEADTKKQTGWGTIYST